MSTEVLRYYVTHIPDYRVVLCNFCETCIPPKSPMRHYEDNHTAKKECPVSMSVRRKIAEYMSRLDLCMPREVARPSEFIPGLKIIKKGFACKFMGCGYCAPLKDSMMTHYYTHQPHVPKNFKG